MCWGVKKKFLSKVRISRPTQKYRGDLFYERKRDHEFRVYEGWFVCVDWRAQEQQIFDTIIRMLIFYFAVKLPHPDILFYGTTADSKNTTPLLPWLRRKKICSSLEKSGGNSTPPLSKAGRIIGIC